MPATDYYKTLGVARDASNDEIRKAYKKLVRKYHPDVKPDDKEAAEKFKEVQEAMDVLGDADKRAHFDRFGTAGPAGGPRGQAWTGRGGPGGPGGGAGPIDLGDLFGGGQIDLGDLFGGAFGGGAGGRQRQAGRKGADVNAEVEIPFQIAVEGGSHEVHLDRGNKREQISIKIPAGVDTGSVIRLAKQGEPGLGSAPAGDLLITLRVAPHRYFRREGNNLLVDVPLAVTEAALGAKVEVPTLSEGLVTLTIPAGTSSGAKLRLRGKGVIDRTTKVRGDQLVVIKIVIPQKLSPRAKELFHELVQAAPQSPRADLW